MKKISAILIGMTLCLIIWGCSGESETNVLHMYTALDSKEAPTYIKAFEKKFNAKVEWVADYISCTGGG